LVDLKVDYAVLEVDFIDEFDDVFPFLAILDNHST